MFFFEKFHYRVPREGHGSSGLLLEHMGHDCNNAKCCNCYFHKECKNPKLKGADYHVLYAISEIMKHQDRFETYRNDELFHDVCAYLPAVLPEFYSCKAAGWQYIVPSRKAMKKFLFHMSSKKQDLMDELSSIEVILDDLSSRL